MVNIANNRLLSLSFDNKLETVILQYHPYQLSMTERSQATNAAGLDRLITYVPPANTTENNITINSYLTALIPDRDNVLNQSDQFINTLAAGLSAGAVATNVLAGLAGRQGLDILDATSSIISLSKGIYDITSGVLSSNVVTASPIGLAQEQFKKINILSEAMNKSIACSVEWDVVMDSFASNKYLITNMNLEVKHLQDATGKTMILDLQLGLIKQGHRIATV